MLKKPISFQGHWALTVSRPCADVTLVLPRVAHLEESVNALLHYDFFLFLQPQQNTEEGQ